ncbi:hypothetical protein OHV05_36885 (plasmid) [Kitasatospora sp. NBC_00070]|uniref:hypothetical protein n=1 Tax=Kitasatospora sp. NBC_00070 TaxID=2975962 RepID=UPI002F90911E
MEESDRGVGLIIGPDPVDVLARVRRADLDPRRFLAASAYSVAAMHPPLAYVREGAERTTAVRDMISMFTEIGERHGG